MAIKREIYVTQKRLDVYIDITYGSDLIPIVLKVTDYTIPSGAVATAYSIGKEDELRKRICSISDNEISFTPPKEFFDEGSNAMQIRVTYDDKDLISFEIFVRCQKSIVKDDVEEVENNPTLVQQLLSKIGTLSARLNEALSIPEGGTTADAALNDIKIGHDGTEYDSPGDAVREQVKGVLEYAKQVESDVDEKLANSGFITNMVADLINYYTKSETYTQEEINQLVSTIPKFSIQPVTELPTEEISTTTVYLLTTGEESQNLYTEYIYVNGIWEKLGTQKLDLSGYALKTDIPTKLSELVNDSEFITAAVDNLVNYYTKKEVDEKLYLKANSIISTTSGTSIPITDSAKAKPKNIKLYGKTEQPSTEGNQLFDAYAERNTSRSTAEVTENGYNIKCTFTSAYALVRFRLDASLFKANTTYLLIADENPVNCHIQFVARSEGVAIAESSLDNGSILTSVSIGNIDFTPFADAFDEQTHLGINIFIDNVNNAGEYNIKGLRLIEEGTNQTVWEPFTNKEASPNMNYPQPLNSHGDSGSIVGKVLGGNLLGSYDVRESYGIYCKVDNGINHLYGTARQDATFVWVIGGYTHTQEELTLEAGTYSIEDNYQIHSYDGSVRNTYRGTFTINEKISITGILYEATFVEGTTYDQYIEIMFNVGDSLKDYEPYTEQPFTTLTPNGLPGIPLGQSIPYKVRTNEKLLSKVYHDGKQYWIGDIIDYERRKYIKVVLKYVLDGSTIHGYNNSGIWHIGYTEFPSIFGGAVIPPALSTYFRIQSDSYTGVADELQELFYNKMYFDGNGGCIGFNASMFSTADADGFKTFFAEHPTEICAIAVEPIETDLSEEEMAQYNALLMNYPNTTIVNDAGAYMEVEYVCDTQEHIKQNYTPKSVTEDILERLGNLETQIANQ